VSILLVSSGVEKYHQKLIDGCLNGHSRKVGPHSLHQAHCVMRESLANVGPDDSNNGPLRAA
jgi:hypothetical protein